MKPKIISMLLILIFSLFLSETLIAKVYLYWDAEEHPCNMSPLPNPPVRYTEAPTPGHVICGEAPQGARFSEWAISLHQTSFYSELFNSNFKIENILGKTFYLAYYMRIERIGGVDVWHPSGQSADKTIELFGTGLRIIGLKGHWEDMKNNRAGRYTFWLMEANRLNNGNPSWEPLLQNFRDAMYLNQSGYSNSNPIQLEYEKWHAVVMKVKINSLAYAQQNTPDGEVAIWLNGAKVLEYKSMWIASGNNPTIDRISAGGTIAQPAYDAPAHKQQYDGLILTDDWQDIVNGGYLKLGAPSAPMGLRKVR